MNVRTFTVTMLAVILVLLTLASAAWAGCAWVLWGRPKNDPRGDWAVVDAFTSTFNAMAKSACERAAKETARPEVVWVCLPDTVDPRAPKAGR
jgi:hypothetical protein